MGLTDRGMYETKGLTFLIQKKFVCFLADVHFCLCNFSFFIHVKMYLILTCFALKLAFQF